MTAGLVPQIGRETGYHPFIVDVAVEMLEPLVALGIVSKDDIYLDFGAGTAESVIAAAHVGLTAFGIELHPGLTRLAYEKILLERDEGFIAEDVGCRVVQGSYYPQEYVALREQGGSVAAAFERGLFFANDSLKSERIAFPESLRDRVHHVRATPHDPYEKLDITLRDVSVFFSYTWGVELPAHLELFSRYASKDAVFLNRTGRPLVAHDALVDALGLRYEEHKYDSSVAFPIRLYRMK